VVSRAPSVLCHPMETSSSTTHTEPEKRLPVEIWRHIFSLATNVLEQDEFSLDEASYHWMPWNSAAPSGLIHEAQLEEIIKTRFCIIQVCKAWYFIGLPGLWSHLRLGCSKWDLSQLRAQYSLIKKPELAPFVRRLTIRYRSTSDHPPSLNFIAKKLLPLFTSLKIISCPLVCCIDKWPLPGEIAILQSHSRFRTRSDFAAVSGLSRWENIRILSVDFGVGASAAVFNICRELDTINSGLDILFPHLQSLQLFTFEADTIQYITSRWQLPSLKTLLIKGIRSSVWGGLLENHKTKLEALVLNDYDEPVMPHITFPQLRTLYFRAAEYSGVYDAISAPRLERYGLYGGFLIDAPEISGSVRRAISTFPSTNHVDLSIHQFRDFSPVLQARFMEKFEFMHGTGIKLEVRTI
jgi:hypothetical protein